MIKHEEALKIVSCFGGGMWHGETCGCVSGALMVLGIKYDHCMANDNVTKEELLKLKFDENRTKFGKAINTISGVKLIELMREDELIRMFSEQIRYIVED